MAQKLRFSAMSVAYVQHSWQYLLDSFQRLGMQDMEFWAAGPHYYGPMYPTQQEREAKLAQIKEDLEQHNMQVVMYTPETLNYPYSYSHPDPKVRDFTVQYMEEAVDDALALGCTKVFINSGCGLRDIPHEISWDNCRDSFRRICQYADQRGVEIVLEQLQPYESNLITTQDDCLKMLNDVDCPNLKICLDLVAMEVAGEKIEEYFDAFGSKVVHIHLADRNHEILGSHDYPLETYLQYLKQVNFDQHVSLEINDSIYWDDPEESLKQSLTWLRERNYI